MAANEPMDPLSGDPVDPSAAMGDDDTAEPLTEEERDEVVALLENLEVFRLLLEPRGVRGIVETCEGCGQPHYYDWDLYADNLRHELDAGQSHVHEPAFRPDPAEYVSLDYAYGFVDGVESLDDEDDAG